MALICVFPAPESLLDASLPDAPRAMFVINVAKWSVNAAFTPSNVGISLSPYYLTTYGLLLDIPIGKARLLPPWTPIAPLRSVADER